VSHWSRIETKGEKVKTVKQALISTEIVGLADMQMDHYFGAAQDPNNLDDKMYLDESGGLCMPAENILHMFYGTFYASAINLVEKKMEWKKAAWEAKALMFIEPNMVPILRDGEQVIHKGWKKTKSGRLHDPEAGIWLDDSLPRVKGGVVAGDQGKLRPTLKKPWAMRFNIRVIEEEGSPVTVERIEKWLETGGMKIGIGTHRPVYGRFEVVKFDVSYDGEEKIVKKSSAKIIRKKKK